MEGIVVRYFGDGVGCVWVDDLTAGPPCMVLGKGQSLTCLLDLVWY